ncbi:lipoprotein [Salinibacterium sp. ZJ70]|uniref:LptM family lipoprotein n=1 Tax=Salinibacterium sp. ZJ70 TaxID=2708084 RepID=UPI00142259CC|nr:hypothetical protein [Salinibacterium sp. ZJ70]
MRRILAPLVLLVTAVTLSGCIMTPNMPRGDRDDRDRDAMGPKDKTSECDGELTISQKGHHKVGDCDELTIDGDGIDVDAGEIRNLIIRGDDADIEATSIDSVDLEGQKSDVESRGDVGEIVITGDRNGIDVDGEIGTVTLNGNDNEVEATGAIGPTTDNGERNEVLADQR